MNKKYSRVIAACYTTSITMSIVANLSPILFITFNSLYGISYSLLGLLVLINFLTQLSVDLIFSFFSHKFNIKKTVAITPAIAVLGIVIYAVLPYLLKDSIYLCLVIGTIIFSAAAGLAEVLISPTIAAIPSDDPDHEMSKLHSIYAWGVVGMILFSTVFLLIFGNDNWQILSLILAIVPLISAILFSGADIPVMKTSEKSSGVLQSMKDKSLWLCFFAIFLGGSAECTMAQWCSGYIEQALKIPKLYGDIFGVALFSLTLGLGRTLYSKYGKNIAKVLFFSAIGATLCYLVSSVINIPVIGLIACAMTGIFTAMMWPGCLIIASDRFPNAGVFIYALMAAGGDFGASIGPQLVGIITDSVIASEAMTEFGNTLGLLPEQFGMKLGMLVGMLFPLIATFVYLKIWKSKQKDVA